MSQQQGRGSAIHMKIAIAALLLTLSFPYYVTCTTYTVGDAAGWSFGVESWTNGKNFKAGDILVFKYSSNHNVVTVDAIGYRSCTTSSSSKTFTSGDDKLTLAKGTNYFICGVPGHCGQKMKIAATAT